MANNRAQQPRSHLFTVRIWPEECGDGQTEWRGRVEYVLSGETHHFRDWPTLIDHLQSSLKENSTILAKTGRH